MRLEGLIQTIRNWTWEKESVVILLYWSSIVILVTSSNATLVEHPAFLLKEL